ncbi:MAG: hypothetical protein FWC51_04685 [Proteobacteria bacterium]|nr:hypothetical protein [Pseudomonadota bacterium]
MPKSELKNKLSAWTWKAPAKFAALTTVFYIVFLAVRILITNFATYLVKSGAPGRWIAYGMMAISLLMIALLIFAIFFALVKAVHWSPEHPLDRHSFVAVDTGLSIIQIVFIALTFILTFFGYKQMVTYVTFMAIQFDPIYIALFVLMTFAMSYVSGTIVVDFIAMFRRGRAMGVKKWKMILGIPFGLSAIGATGYILPEEKKAESAVSLKSNWFKSFINWIVKTPLNASAVLIVWGAAAVLLNSSGPSFFGIFSTALVLVLFFVPWAVWGTKKLRGNAAGIYATILAIINIAVVLYFLIGFAIGFWNALNVRAANPQLPTNPAAPTQIIRD